MATSTSNSSIVRQVNRAENWEAVYSAFTDINFTAWDFDSIKKSLLDYLKLYYPEEDFNDYIETSELVALIELFAYVGELVAYRQDMNAHENLLPVADRKESILRLVKLISYNVSRNIAARGLVKITSISTTEPIYDSTGNNISNKSIYWNDPNNANWKDQFIIVMNHVLAQSFGSIPSSDKVQVQDVVFELYQLNNNTITNNVIKYNVNVAGQSYPMELVSSDLNEYGPIETRPESNLDINILYLSDGLGDSSDNTGFFFFTKQGILQRTVMNFDGVTPNQTYDISINNINQTDVWVNNIDPSTNSVSLTNGQKTGYWFLVDVANGQNVVFNTNPEMNKYEIETLNNDQCRFVFGDGNFANIPSGTFEFWTRSSAGTDLVIPASAIQNISENFTYQDSNYQNQTFSFSFSLIDPIQNAAPSENIDHIRTIAPSYYYTQDRMVNGRDYNEFMLQDNSILKLRSINRTFSGDSKYIAWHDPREYYDNVKLFTDDGVVYFETYQTQDRVPPSDLPLPDQANNTALVNALLNNYIQPLLSTNDFTIKCILNQVVPSQIRREFNPTEITQISNALSSAANNMPETIWLNYQTDVDVWSVYSYQPNTYWISIESQTNGYWYITFYGFRLVVHSDGIRFWVTNNGDKTITYDTLNANYDEISILSANISFTGNLIGKNHYLNVLQQKMIEEGENKGLASINDLLVVPSDENGDGVPDYSNVSYLIGPQSFVYFQRACVDACPWQYAPYTQDVLNAWTADQNSGAGLWKRENGAENVNLLWMHRTPRYHLIDPSSTNIMDSFILTRGYYISYRQWLQGVVESAPEAPSSYQLTSSYGYLLESKMVSDTIVLHSGIIKPAFGAGADPTLQATFQVIPSPTTQKTNNQLKTSIVDAINNFFDINQWQFGQAFYFTALASYIHNVLGTDISSIVLVPTYNNNVFGDLFQIYAKENEIIQPYISVSDIQIVSSLNPVTLQQL